MDTRVHADVTSFWELTKPFYGADPVRYTVEVALLGGRLSMPVGDDQAPLMLSVHEAGELIGALICTPPWPVAVSGIPDRAAPAVVEALVAGGSTVTGVTGCRPEAELFAAVWAQAAGVAMTIDMEHRLYRLAELVPPTTVAGRPRLAMLGSVPLLARWRFDFADEATGGLRDRSAEESSRASILGGDGNVLWEVDGTPVAWAVARAPSLGMSRIGPVYTPAEFRGRGYGSAVTAAAAQWAVDAGAEQVVLFTDLSNAVSNSIYQRIGFRPVHDAVEISFS